MDWHEREGVLWLEADLPGGRAVFSTRQGGVSTGPFTSLNLGWVTEDEPESVYENSPREAERGETETAKLLRALGTSRDKLARLEDESREMEEEREPGDERPEG